MLFNAEWNQGKGWKVEGGQNCFKLDLVESARAINGGTSDHRCC